jgi:two-component system sensor histidine kinase YesM
MTALNFPKTLKSRLILYFLAITIIPSVAISFFYFKNSQHTLEKNMIGTATSNLNYSMTIIDKQLKNAEQLSDWIFINKNLDTILTKNSNGARVRYSSDIKTFLELVEYQLKYNTSIGTSIYSLLIHGDNGLDLRAGQPEGTQIELAELQKAAWFQKGLKLHGRKFWYGVVENPSTVKFEEYILPLVRPILHSITNREIGWQMIGFRTSLISDLFKNFEVRPDETVLVVDSRGHCVYHHQPRLLGHNLSRLSYVAAILKDSQRQGERSALIGGAKRLVVFAKSQETGWSIIRVLSSAELNRQKQILLNITMIILLSSLVFTSFITVYLSSNLTQPLTKFLQRTKAIAAGNFARDPAIEGRDELGALGRGINEMADNIRSLLDRVIADEREKRRLELDVLQNQVNPHFLYNTLNSLKLMATMQKADGIREMVSALGRLLMNLSKNTAEKISLAEEMALLDDYIYIQNIRYKGKIRLEYHLEDETVLQCLIIKFTLQPIVENAIFHGIEPKKDAGRIAIDIAAEAGQLIIRITDDGVGMTQEQITAVFTAAPPVKTRGLSQIGISNVNQRLQLVYGPGYGLTIESVVGEYTQVAVRVPRETATHSAAVAPG